MKSRNKTKRLFIFTPQLSTLKLIAILFILLFSVFPCLSGQAPKIVIQKGLSDSVSSVSFSPDSKMLASASDDNTVKLWDLNLGFLLKIFKGHLNRVNSVSFSPNGKILASASDDKAVNLWDLDSGALLRTLKGHLNRVNSVSFSPDGKMLASASDDNTVKLWGTDSGALLKTLKGHLDRVNSASFSRDGKMLGSASDDKTVKLWDPNSGALLKTLKGHYYWVNSVSFSRDGKMLASASDDNTVKLWDPDSGALLKTLKGHSNRVNSVSFSRDGKMLGSASYDKTVKLWDTDSGSLLKTLKGHLNRVNLVSFSRDGKRIASASDDTSIKIWNAETGGNILTMLSLDKKRWVVWTQEGFYDSSKGAAKYAAWRVGNNLFSFQRYQNVFLRPDKIRLALKGKSLKQASIKIARDFPPILRFIDVPAKTDKTFIKIKLEYKGIHEFRDMMLFVNGRALKFQKRDSKADGNFILTAAAKLAPNSINTINAVAFDNKFLRSENIVHNIECGSPVKLQNPLKIAGISFNKRLNTADIKKITLDGEPVEGDGANCLNSIQQ